MAKRRALWWIGLSAPTVIAFGAWAQQPAPVPPTSPSSTPTAAPSAPTAAPSAPTAVPSAPPPAGSETPPAPKPDPSSTPLATPSTVPVVPVPDLTKPQPEPKPKQQRPRYPYDYRYRYPYPYRYPYRYGPARPPPRIPYREGEPAPKGYKLETRARKGWVIAGSVTFGATYLISVAVGAALQQEDTADQFSPLFIPLAGPFIATGTADASAFGTFALIVDGMSQVFGLGAFLFGMLDEERVWVREEAAVDVSPLFVGGEPAGASVSVPF